MGDTRHPVSTRKNFLLPFLVAVFCLMSPQISLHSEDPAAVFREYIKDIEEVARVHSVIVTVRFKEALLTGEYTKNGTEFVFPSTDRVFRVFFKSEKLAGIHLRLNNDTIFRDFISRSRIFGVDTAGHTMEGRVLLGGICHDKNCADEDFVVIHSD